MVCGGHVHSLAGKRLFSLPPRPALSGRKDLCSSGITGGTLRPEEEGVQGGGGGGQLQREGAMDGRGYGAGGSGAGRAGCCPGKAVRGTKGHHNPHSPALGVGAARGAKADQKALT